MGDGARAGNSDDSVDGVRALALRGDIWESVNGLCLSPSTSSMFLDSVPDTDIDG